jgi:hypothetical protein
MREKDRKKEKAGKRQKEKKGREEERYETTVVMLI